MPSDTRTVLLSTQTMGSVLLNRALNMFVEVTWYGVATMMSSFRCPASKRVTVSVPRT